MEKLIDEVLKVRARGRSILYCSVRHKGEALLSHWFESLNPQEPLPVFSVSKTVTALLVGAAVDAGVIPGVNAPVTALLAQYGSLVPENLTLQHLLTMTAGYDWPETATFGSADGVFRQFLHAEDPVGFVLERSRVASPGEAYAYSSGVSHMLMAILARSLGHNPVEFGRTALWEPLGLDDTHWRWQTDRNGLPYGGHGLHLTAEAMNRLGQMLLADGVYGGRGVLSRAFITDMASIHIEKTRGYAGYGYQTWIGDVGEHRFFAAFGHGGQRIYLFPELQLQVVFLGQKVLPEFGIHERLIRTAVLPEIGR